MTDVVIMGGGPAGLTLACSLAQAGIRHVVLERGHHPRPRVGESLLPSALRVFDEIGFLPMLDEAGFPRSPGVAYHPLDDDEPVVVDYDEFGGDPGVQGAPRGYSYHADRARLDMLLMKYAESEGARIVQGAAVREVEFDGDGAATGVRADVGTESITIPARIVVDATGHQTLLGRQLGLRTRDPELDQIGLHAWFEGVYRGGRPLSERAQIFFLPIHRGWAWLSPINEHITSVGLVTNRSSFQAWDAGIDRYFRACVGSGSALARALEGARPLKDLRAEPSMNYGLEQICGDGWLAVGDAARFVDPVFSSGVGVAVASARRATEVIQAALAGGRTDAAALRPYQDQTFEIAAVWRDFVRLYYRVMPGFTVLLRSPRYRTSLLRILQGDIDPELDGGLVGEMASLVGGL